MIVKVESIGRVPAYEGDPLAWFRGLNSLGLLFHPEDSPFDIIDMNDKPIFTEEEAVAITYIMRAMDKDHEDANRFAYEVLMESQYE